MGTWAQRPGVAAGGACDHRALMTPRNFTIAQRIGRGGGRALLLALAAMLALPSATASALLDETPPTTVVQSTLPRPFALTRAANFTLSSNEVGVRYRCRLDAASFARCTTPMRYTGLGYGSHTFRARAIDLAGNVDRTPAVWVWTIPHDDRSLRHGARWRELTAPAYWRGTAIRSRARDATVVRHDVRAVRLALVATECPVCGTADVFHGDTRIARLDLSAPALRHRRIIPLETYEALSPARDVRIVVTSRDKPVIIDGLGIATR